MEWNHWESAFRLHIYQDSCSLPFMRKLFRNLAPIITFVFIVLAALTVETVADESGYVDSIRGAIRAGWRSLIDAGYAGFVSYGAVFFFGVTIALWVDYWLKRRAEKSTETVNSVLVFRTGKHWFDPVQFLHQQNAYNFYVTTHTEIEVILVFEQTVEEGHIGVVSTKENLKWTELQLTDKSLILKIDGKFTEAEFLIEIVPAIRKPGVRRQAPNVEYDVECVKVESLLLLLPQGTESRTRR